MRTGDLTGDLRQRRIPPPVIVEAFFKHGHAVSLATPLADQPCAGLQADPHVEGRPILRLQLLRECTQLALCRALETAMHTLLQRVSDGADQQVAVDTLGWMRAIEPSPFRPERLRVEIGELGGERRSRGNATGNAPERFSGLQPDFLLGQ